MLAMVGTIMMPITKPAESALNCFTCTPNKSCRSGVSQVSAK